MTNNYLTVHNQTNDVVAFYGFQPYSYMGQGDSPTYFGSLTLLGIVPWTDPGLPKTLTIPSPVTGCVIYDEQGNPLLSCGTQGVITLTTTSLQAGPQASAFINLMNTAPDNHRVIRFKNMLTKESPLDYWINQFFGGNETNGQPNFLTYMLAVAQAALSTPNADLASQVYSLMKLYAGLELTWPADVPDLDISNFYVNCSNPVQIGGMIQLGSINFADGILPNIQTFLGGDQYLFNTQINNGLTVSHEMTAFNFSASEGEATFSLENAIVSLTGDPVAKQFDLGITGQFMLGGVFKAQATLTITTSEVQIAFSNIKSDLTLFPSIPGFTPQSVTVAVGITFKPATVLLGLQGAFQFGSNGSASGDEFLAVFQSCGSGAEPVYLSFYVPNLNLGDMLGIFTGNFNNILGQIPLSTEMLSVIWCDSPTGPILLPDGTTAAPGISASGFFDLFGLDGYGSLAVHKGSNSIKGTIELAPLSIGSIFSLTGDGQGITVNVDANGNPIKNNQTPPTPVAGTKQLVAPGGAELTIDSSVPSASIGASVKFLDASASVTGSASASGLSFSLDVAAIVTGGLAVTLAANQVTGQFTFGESISLPSLFGVDLGTLSADLGVLLTITESGGLSAGVSCMILGNNYGPETVTLSPGTDSIASVISQVGEWVLNNVESFFSDLYNDATRWAAAVYAGIVNLADKSVHFLISTFNQAYQLAVNDVYPLLKDSINYINQDIASVVQAMQQVYGFANVAATDVANMVNNVFNASAQVAGYVLKLASYAAEDAANALRAAFQCTATEAGAILQIAGYAILDVANALKNVFEIDIPSVLNTVLSQAGYGIQDIANAFNEMGGDFANFANNVLNNIIHYLNPGNW